MAAQETIPTIATVGLSAGDRARLEAIGHALEARVRHVGSALEEGVLDELAALRPSIVVSFEEYPNSAAPLALMDLGAVLVGRPNPRTAWEVLDGFNALLVETGSHDAVTRALRDLVEDAEVRVELGTNGRESARFHHSVNADEFVAQLESIARTPV
jgi:glycosyltransferase involved in cell wall biosynthesis